MTPCATELRIMGYADQPEPKGPAPDLLEFSAVFGLSDVLGDLPT
jgi:hypothetical protein